MLFGLEQRRSILTQWQHDIRGLRRFQPSSSLIRENQEFWWLIICRNRTLQKQMPTPSSLPQQRLRMLIKPCVSPRSRLGRQIHTWTTTALRHPSGLGRAVGLPHAGTLEGRHCSEWTPLDRSCF